MLPDYITLVSGFGAPTGFRSPYCWLTTSDDSQFTTGALLWAQRVQNIKAAKRRPTLVSREGLEPSASTFAQWRPIRWAIARWPPYPDSNRGSRLRRAALSPPELYGTGSRDTIRTYIWAVNSRLPYQLGDPAMFWSRRLGSNQRPPRSKRGMLPLHHTWMFSLIRARGTTRPAAHARRGLGRPRPCAPTHACSMEEARGLAPQTPRGATCFRDRPLV